MTTVEITTPEGVSTGPVPIEDIKQASEGLFDGREYQRPVPALDGHTADTLKLTFAGGVEIDLTIDDDINWFKTLRFGQELDLHITAKVAKVGWTHKVTGEEETETVTHTLGLSVHSIDRLGGEDL